MQEHDAKHSCGEAKPLNRRERRLHRASRQKTCARQRCKRGLLRQSACRASHAFGEDIEACEINAHRHRSHVNRDTSAAATHLDLRARCLVEHLEIASLGAHWRGLSKMGTEPLPRTRTSEEGARGLRQTSAGVRVCLGAAGEVARCFTKDLVRKCVFVGRKELETHATLWRRGWMNTTP